MIKGSVKSIVIQIRETYPDTSEQDLLSILADSKRGSRRLVENVVLGDDADFLVGGVCDDDGEPNILDGRNGRGQRLHSNLQVHLSDGQRDQGENREERQAEHDAKESEENLAGRMVNGTEKWSLLKIFEQTRQYDVGSCRADVVQDPCAVTRAINGFGAIMRGQRDV